MKIASWNINSVRLRQDIVCEYLKQSQCDILALQETKTEDIHFPHQAFQDIGYEHIYISGQKSYNGVAFISKIPLSDINIDPLTPDDGARHITASIHDKIRLRNFYIPAGGDIADESENPKFKHKMTFLRTLRNEYKQMTNKQSIILGDFNIAPHENDVWSHKQLLKVVSHTPHEVALLNELKVAGDFYDIFREKTADDQKLYSWWSYRSKDWKKSNRGRRLDHIWCSNDLKDNTINIDIATDFRSKTKPSDHVPICIDIDLG